MDIAGAPSGARAERVRRKILDFGGPKMRVSLVKSALPALWSSEEEKLDPLGGLCQFPLFTPGASGVKIGNWQKPS